MQFLKKFGIELDEDHSYLGNTKSTIELFHKQLYLVKEKFTQEGQNESMYESYYVYVMAKTKLFFLVFIDLICHGDNERNRKYPKRIYWRRLLK